MTNIDTYHNYEVQERSLINSFRFGYRYTPWITIDTKKDLNLAIENAKAISMSTRKHTRVIKIMHGNFYETMKEFR